jgi:hypothetical protein
MRQQITPIKPLELMNGEFNDFIGVWEDHVPKSVCKKFINYFEDKIIDESSNNLTEEEKMYLMVGNEQFKEKNLGRSDLSILLNYCNIELANTANQYLQACLLDYINYYGQLANTRIISTEIKFQRTQPGGGYHVWHYENAGISMAQRVLTWMIYLNDMPEGEAETEFLYQKRRISPKAGTCVIWPAAFTHVHRGLTVYSENKYILTGWYINATVV